MPPQLAAHVWAICPETWKLAMDSKVAQKAREALLADTQRLSPEERLNAFLAHYQLMMALYQAGQQLRTSFRRS